MTDLEQEDGGAPRGRQAVMDAIVCAAAELFGQRGPARVSGREIASRAGVNYGLIHRHFGGMDELRRKVMTRLAHDIASSLRQAESGSISHVEVLARHADYWRALARAALDGEDLRALQDEYPVIDRLLGRRGGGEADSASIEKRTSVAAASAALLGWAVFSDFIREATGLAELDDASMDRHLEAALTRLFNAP